MEDSHTEHSAPTGSKRNSQMPPCCGSGCAVCILDYWVDDEPGDIPQQLLQAFEEAEQLAKQMIAQNDSETGNE